MSTQNGIFLGVPGHSHIIIAVIKSGLAVREFVRKELEPAVKDKTAPLEELLNNSGILIKFDGGATLIGNLVTTAGGTYLRFDEERRCFVLPDGVRYSGQLRYDNVYNVELNEEKTRELASVLNKEGLNNVQIPEDTPRDYMPRILEARRALESFVQRYTS